MCAIAGIWTRDRGPVDPARLRILRDAMRERGPDDAGQWIDGDLGLAHRRLSIVDLSAAGRQPLVGEGGRMRVVFNGEIYNHRALRATLEASGHRFTTQTDGEVLVHGWEEWGPALLPRLNGMFAFAVWDGVARRLVLARDRLGVKPLYVLETGGTLAFASSIDALAGAFPEAVSLDWTALDAYLHFGFVPQELGVYREIAAVPPGHLLDVRGHEARLERWWSLRFAPTRGRDWPAAVRRVLGEAVARRLPADVPVGLLLSGGVDSSVVAALATRAGGAPEAFTIGFADRRADPDVEAATAVAAHLGLRHHVRRLDADAAATLDALVPSFGAPFGDPSAIPTYHAGRLAADHHTKVVLTGDGGDEVFGGYANVHAAWVGALVRRVAARLPGGAALLGRLADLDAHVPETSRALHRAATLCRYAGGDLAARARWTNGWHGDALRAVRGPALRAVATDADAILVRHAEAADARHDVERLLYADLAVVLPGDYLVKVDVGLMASSVEGRSPFLDVRAIELGAAIPLGVKLSPWRPKHLLKRVATDLGLPAAAIHRPKQGFGAPIGAWLRGPLRETARDALLHGLPLRGVVDADVVGRAWQTFVDGAGGQAGGLWILLCLELWFRRCVDTRAGGTVRASA